jgi:transposase-like protein
MSSAAQSIRMVIPWTSLCRASATVRRQTIFRKFLKSLRYAPRVSIIDKLKSYAATKVQIMSDIEHRQHKALNNCAELSHQPTRQRGRFVVTSHLGMRSAFGRHTSPSTTSSGVSAIAYRRSSTGTSVLKHFQSRMR